VAVGVDHPAAEDAQPTKPLTSEKLAVLMMPADPRRFEEDFDRLLRVVAPYDILKWSLWGQEVRSPRKPK
jgi:hypothetical protein